MIVVDASAVTELLLQTDLGRRRYLAHLFDEGAALQLAIRCVASAA